MIWLTWRQFRSQLVAAVGVLIALGVAFAFARNSLSQLYTDSGLGTCTTDCRHLLDGYLDALHRSVAYSVIYVGLAAIYLAPPLIGAFWGAPLLARELETGTYRLAWSQSVTRTRWLLTKLGGLGAAAVALTGVLSLAVTWSASSFDKVNGNRLGPLLFGARGVVPLGYAAFAFALGVTLGMVLRRTIPAMAATLGIYAIAVVAMPVWLRQFLVPIRHATPAFDMTHLDGFSLRSDGLVTLTGGNPVAGSWLLSNTTIDPSGAVYNGPANMTYCGENAGPKTCLDYLGTLHLRQSISYHTLDQYWLLQWIETGLFVALAVALAGFSLWWVRRRSV